MQFANHNLQALLRIARATDPQYPVPNVHKFFLKHEKFLQLRELDEGQVLFRKCEQPDGVYVVMEGELAVYEPAQKDEIIRIFSRDFVFDVECVYDIASLYTVKAFSK